MSLFRPLYRIVRKTNFIIICIVSMLLFFSVIIGNVEALSNSILELNNQLTKNHIGIYFDSNLTNKEILGLIDEIEQNEDIILKYYLQTGFDYDGQSQGIFFNGLFNSGFTLLEGRFFTKEDFKTNNKLVVIGKDNLSFTKMENEKKYIFRGLDKYEVIGIIGKEKISSRYDNIILYNLNSIFNNNENLANDTWWLDSVNKDKFELQKIVNTIGKGKIKISQSTDYSPNPLDQALNRSQILLSSFIIVILCILLTLVRAILYWIDKISIEIGIRKNYGATKNEVLLEIIKRYTLIACISIAISFLLHKFLSSINLFGIFGYKISYLNFLLSIIFILMLGVFFIFIAIYRINKIEINQLLKES